MLEIPAMIKEAGQHTLDLCYQCGTCSGTCPWNLVREFRVRDIIVRAQLGLSGYEDEDLWLCATCNACVDRCPRGVEIVDVIRSIRSILKETGTIPRTLRSVMASVVSNGNPWSGEASARMSWAKNVTPPHYDGSQEHAYFACCSQAYDPPNAAVARAAMAVLGAAGVSFGVLDGEMQCCGDAVRKGGGEDVFTSLATSNSAAFAARRVRKLIVASPHCLSAFTKEYPLFGAKVQVKHLATVVREALDAGKLVPTRAVPRKVIYHDPCYLGRHSGVYEDPRAVLSRLPGVELLEFDRSREDSVCCGGGGGRLWMETPPEERFSTLKLREALAKGADTLATSCPYCIAMFNDARTVLDQDGFRVADVTELVAEAL
jgi:Fe-S oxidoreductase